MSKKSISNKYFSIVSEKVLQILELSVKPIIYNIIFSVSLGVNNTYKKYYNNYTSF